MARKRHFFKRMTAAMLSAALLALPLGAAAAEGGQAEGAQEPALVIYTTGDMAGRVYRQNPLTGQDAGVGYQNVAAAVAGDADTAEAALLLDSGDAVDSGLLQDGGAAEALALRAIGYDVLVPGLGELRLAPEDRADFFAALEAEEGEGSPVQVLSGTYLDGEGEEPVEGAYEVFSVELDGTEVRVGVLGLTAADVGGALSPEYQEDVRFAHQDNEENSLAWEWSCYWQERLEAEDCDLVVVVCSAERDAVAQFAAQTSGIDLVVGGRGSAGAETLQNADGEDVSWVSGGGAALTRTAVTLAPDGTPVVGESTLLELEDYEPDSGLSQLLSDSWDAAEERLQEPVGTLAGDWSEAGDPRYVQTATAELAAQAMVWAAGADGALLAPRDLGGQTVAGLFEEGEDTLELSLADCAALLPDSAPIVAVELTGAQLKAWLEACAEDYTLEPDGSISGGGEADALYGLDYTLYLGAGQGEQVDGLALDGEPVEDDQVLRVAVSARRLSDPAFPEGQVVWSSARDGRFAAQGGAPAALLAAYVSHQTEALDRLFPQHTSTWTLYPGSADGPLNRLEFVTMLYEMAGRPEPGASAAFIDVGESDAAVWAAETGVVSGNGQGMFLPTQTVTREQVAVMLYNYARFLGVEAPESGPSAAELADYDGIAAWARPAVEFCVRTGVLTAGGDGSFDAAGTITREEAAVCLEQLAAVLEEAAPSEGE